MGVGTIMTMTDRINAGLKKLRRIDGAFTHKIGSSAGGKTRVAPGGLKSKEIKPGVYKL